MVAGPGVTARIGVTEVIEPAQVDDRINGMPPGPVQVRTPSVTNRHRNLWLGPRR